MHTYTWEHVLVPLDLGGPKVVGHSILSKLRDTIKSFSKTIDSCICGLFFNNIGNF